MQTFQRVAGLSTHAMTRTLFFLAVLILTGSGCSSPSPVAPGATQQGSQPAAQFAAISGQVYANVTWGNPPITDAIIRVTDADGSIKFIATDEQGFYKVLARPGDVSITASKEGYEARTWELTLLKDIVLNFGLAPD